MVVRILHRVGSWLLDLVGLRRRGELQLHDAAHRRTSPASAARLGVSPTRLVDDSTPDSASSSRCDVGRVDSRTQGVRNREVDAREERARTRDIAAAPGRGARKRFTAGTNESAGGTVSELPIPQVLEPYGYLIEHFRLGGRSRLRFLLEASSAVYPYIFAAPVSPGELPEILASNETASREAEIKWGPRNSVDSPCDLSDRVEGIWVSIANRSDKYVAVNFEVRKR